MNELFYSEKISMKDLESLEQSAPNIIIYAAPIMFLFVLIEYLLSTHQNKGYYKRKETLGSILVGLGNVTIGVLIKTILFILFVLVYNLVPWRMELDWWTFIPCYLIFDLASYWTHRISHHVRFFWASHIPHHSAEQFNLTVSFRLSWVQYIKIIFILPVALIGFHPVIIFITNQIAILFQFWVHTEYIKKLHPWIEYVLATPSNHRVHHGSQHQYINKNFAATFILWDRIFGTYEKEDEVVRYGITNNIQQKHNPLHINFHEYVAMCKDVWQAKSLSKKLFFILGDPQLIASYKLAQLQEDNK
jgi:sterol desaturase/sphingolipid hydroxylase (fatty acid hydroxylase superfamily)